MATGKTILNKNTGAKAFFPAEIVADLQQAHRLYAADAYGMAEGGTILTSTFISYCDVSDMQARMDASGQIYKGTAAQYAHAYNKLFYIQG